ncbi:MAG: UDP-N-acetylmuramoyl-tripeptide--D-alanyl-D-alanine ligase, partial [Nitrospirae bacterium]
MRLQATAEIAQDKESMGLFTVEELREVISVKVLAGQDSLSGKQRIRQISTDSRSVRRGDLFVALRGDRYDGHEFVPAVLAQGAVGAIVHDEYRLPPSSVAVRRIEGRPAPFLFGVRDSLFAYQQLATHHRSRFHIPVVAVTGSNGKTTTKDMVAAVLAQRWPVLKTEGNFNNRIGVPYTLLRLTARHQAAVIEMGVDQQGFGFSERAEVRASGVTSDVRQGTTFRLHLPGKSRPTIVRIKVHGTHNVTNALASAAVGSALNLSGSMIAQGLGRFRPAAMRSQVVTHHGVHIINDCYNANPASMKAALQLLAQ